MTESLGSMLESEAHTRVILGIPLLGMYRGRRGTGAEGCILVIVRHRGLEEWSPWILTRKVDGGGQDRKPICEGASVVLHSEVPRGSWGRAVNREFEIRGLQESRVLWTYFLPFVSACLFAVNCLVDISFGNFVSSGLKRAQLSCCVALCSPGLSPQFLGLPRATAVDTEAGRVLANDWHLFLLMLTCDYPSSGERSRCGHVHQPRGRPTGDRVATGVWKPPCSLLGTLDSGIGHSWRAFY